MNMASTGGAFVASLVLLVAVLSLGEVGSCVTIPESITLLINANHNGSATVSFSNSWCVGWDNAYQLSVASVGLVLSLIGCALMKCKPALLTVQLGRCQLPLVGALTVDMLLSSLLFLWLTVGAIVLTTMEDGGFQTTSNGYFACAMRAARQRMRTVLSPIRRLHAGLGSSESHALSRTRAQQLIPLTG